MLSWNQVENPIMEVDFVQFHFYEKFMENQGFG